MTSGRDSAAPPAPNASDDLFEISFRNAPIGVALVDPSGHWLDVNEAICRLFGYTREELLAGTFQDITHPDDLSADLTLLQEVLAGKRDRYRMEKRYFHKDGHIIWAQLTATMARNADGSPRCFISHVEDITQAVHDREDLHKLSERLQLATHAASIGVVDYNIPQGVGQGDERFFAIYGLPPRADGRVDFDDCRSRLHPADSVRLLDELREMTTTGQPLDTTHRILLPDGSEKMLHLSACVLTEENRPARCIAVTRDITNQYRASEELRAARDAAEAASRAKSAFLAVMSHEIRTPLHGIIGHSHLLAETNVTAEQSAHLSTILSSGDALLAIIEDILDYSKIEAGKLQLEAAPLSLRRCIEASMSTLRPRAEAKRLRFEVTVEPDVPDMVIGDQIRLRQVLTNLLSNAVKFTTEGTVRLLVSADSATHCLRFRVSDTGIGIPADRIADVFKPFNQLDASITRRFGGTGLGLAICKQLVVTMGGTIDVQSSLDRGTDIVVSIPLLVAETASASPAAEPPLAPPKRGNGMPVFSPAVAGLRILAAEDNAVNRHLVQLLLRKSGSRHVETVENGQEAVDRLETGTIDVVLMDCEMPHLDGYKATREIRRRERENPARPRVSIIALTAGAFPEHRQRALDSGMDDFLTKPLRPDALAEALNRCVTARQISQSALSQ